MVAHIIVWGFKRVQGRVGVLRVSQGPLRSDGNGRSLTLFEITRRGSKSYVCARRKDPLVALPVICSALNEAACADFVAGYGWAYVVPCEHGGLTFMRA